MKKLFSFIIIIAVIIVIIALVSKNREVTPVLEETVIETESEGTEMEVGIEQEPIVIPAEGGVEVEVTE